MIKIMKTAFCFLMAGVLAISFVTCNKYDNNESKIINPDAVVVDQKEFFQNSLVRMDDKGNFMYRMLGVTLEATDTTRLYVGVEDLIEAKNIFRGLFAPETRMNEIRGVITCYLKDTIGNANGTVVFTPAALGATNGDIASVSFDGCKLMSVSSLNFLQKGSWPNDIVSSPYKKGQIVRMPTLMDGEQNWICLREASLGVHGILYYLGASPVSVNSYRPYASHNNHYLSEISQIRSLLGGNGAYWCAEYYCTSTRYYALGTLQAEGVSCPVFEFDYFDCIKSEDRRDDAQVGDYYMKDGSIINRGAYLTDQQKLNCVGIVCWRGNPTEYDDQLKIDHPECTHGLVIALQDAIGGSDPLNPSNEMSWSKYNFVVGCSSESAGYSNTQKIRKDYSINSLRTVYPVQAVDNYADDFNQPAPLASSGWYLPAKDEFAKLEDSREQLQAQLNKLAKPKLTHYWTSSEYFKKPGTHVWTAEFPSYFFLYYDPKDDNDLCVRSVFAF